jgi:diguanylate cyclase (GGDEF)-like protein
VGKWGLRVIKILMIEDSVEYAAALRLLLEEASYTEINLDQANLVGAGSVGFGIAHVTSVREGRERLAQDRFDIILLDLSLPDSDGYETFAGIHEQALETPIVIITSNDDASLAVRMVSEGAQDFLVKGEESTKPLMRVIRYAIERQKTQLRLQNLSLLDELTGLYNRRGFMTLANQQVKLAHRTKNQWAIVFADLDGLKNINDTFGHHEGDRALREVSRLLKVTFRESDIIARIGGDEFAVLALVAPGPGTGAVIRRLQGVLEAFNASNKLSYHISISFGAAIYDPQSPRSVDELLTQADASMYEQKRKKRGQTWS